MENLSGTKEEAQFLLLVEAASKEDQALLHKALQFAVHHHSGQQRKSGAPYIIHPIGIALRLQEKYADAELTAAALLHDTVEDCDDVCMADIYETFGDDIGFLVDAVTKRRNNFHKDKTIVEDRIERLLFAAKKDVRVLLLKLADRENNLSTIENLKENKQIRMAFETQAVYQPLKRVLGYEQDMTVEQAVDAYNSYWERKGLTSAHQVKEALFSESFENLSNDMFGLVYNDSKSIIWKTKDIETYRRICETPSLNGVVEFLSVKGNDDWFTATFQFKKGAVLGKGVKMDISSYSA